MAQPADVFSSYDAVGNREDLSDVIYDISPTATPFLSSIAKVTATATNHEWQTDSLAAAVATNAVIEGDEATTDAATPTARRGNYTQILDKVPRVTGTQRANDSAGRGDEMDYQVAKRMKEIKRDLESSLLANNAKVAGDDSTARVMAGVEAWIATNTSAGVGGADPTGDGTDARTDGTQRAVTDTPIDRVLASIADAGGEPTKLMVGSFNKQAISGLTGNAPRRVDGQEQVLSQAVFVYRSDFGDLEIVFNRFQRARSALILDMDHWALAALRDFQSSDLSKTGDSDRKLILFEGTLESRNEAASGIVADLTTS
ncbi:MAG TPA: head protein [Alphaproteobacteria bacterium]|nr:head protein [Alphaproteobacteria bacterium]